MIYNGHDLHVDRDYNNEHIKYRYNHSKAQKQCKHDVCV